MIYRIAGNIASNECTFRYDGFLSGHEGDILCMDSNGKDIVATGSADQTVKIWRGAQKRERLLHRVCTFSTER